MEPWSITTALRREMWQVRKVRRKTQTQTLRASSLTQHNYSPSPENIRIYVFNDLSWKSFRNLWHTLNHTQPQIAVHQNMNSGLQKTTYIFSNSAVLGRLLALQLCLFFLLTWSQSSRGGTWYSPWWLWGGEGWLGLYSHQTEHDWWTVSAGRSSGLQLLWLHLKVGSWSSSGALEPNRATASDRDCTQTYYTSWLCDAWWC